MVGKKTNDAMASCSILPGIAGVSPYENASQAMTLSRCIRAKNGEDVRGDQNQLMFMGDLLENTLLEHTVSKLRLINADYDVDYAIRHDDLPLEGSMDAIAYAGEKHRIEHDPGAGIFVMGSNMAEMSGEVVLECKVTRDYPEDEPPPWRGVMQLQGLMDIKKAQWGVLCILYQSTTFRIFIYHRNEVQVKEIHKLVKDFDRRIQEEDPYPPVNPDEALTIWQQADEAAEPIELEEEAKDQIDLIDLSSEKSTYWNEVKKEATANLMAMLKEKEKGVYLDPNSGNQFEVTWPTRHYAAKEQKITHAKDGYSIRLKSLKIREIKNEDPE